MYNAFKYWFLDPQKSYLRTVNYAYLLFPLDFYVQLHFRFLSYIYLTTEKNVVSK